MAINKKYVAAGLAVVLVAGVYAGTNILNAKGASTKGAETVIPAIEEVRIDDVTEYVTASGTVNAAEVNGVYITTTQKVSDVKIKLGDEVKVGDVLVEYDIDYSKKSLENSLRSAQISLQNSNLTLQNLTTSKTEAEILQLENSVASAEKSVVDAQTNLDSANTKIVTLERELADSEKTLDANAQLLSAGAISQDTYDASEKVVTDNKTNLEEAKASITSYELAVTNGEASLKQAQLNLEKAYTPLDSESSQIGYQQQQNEISKSQLSIQNIQDQISDLTETSVAHVEGTIIKLNVEDGSVVSDETTILQIADLNKLIVNANVSEYDAPLVKVGQGVTLTTDAIEDTVYTGEVTYISPVATVTTTFSGSETTVAIEVEITNPDGILKPGYTVDMEILVTDAKDVPTISFGAIQKDRQEDRYFVYTVDENNIIHKTFIEMGAYDDTSAQITTGLAVGEKIVTSPTSDMADNTDLSLYATTVEISTSSEAAGASTGLGINFGGGSAPSGGPSGGNAPSGGGNRVRMEGGM